MTKIYIVTAGSYSDYHIVGVFDNEEESNNVVSALGTNVFSPCQIEEYEINKKQVKKGYSQYFVRIKKDGTVIECYKSSSSYSFDDFGFDVDSNLYSYQFAADEKHAIKIANERRARLIAENKWK